MAPRQVPLKSVSAFAIAGRRGSFHMAAHDLNISPSALSDHVKALGEHLGVTLFERVGNGVALTRAGRKYLNMVQAALGQIEEAGSFLSDAGEETLTIRVAISFLERWLLPNLPDFKASYPGIQLEIDTRRPFGDFTSAPLDAEIRFGTSIPGDYHVEPLMVENIMPMCSPVLAASFVCPPDLNRHPMPHSTSEKRRVGK